LAVFFKRLQTVTLSDLQIQLGRIRKVLGTDGFLSKKYVVVQHKTDTVAVSSQIKINLFLN
jgi:hypothetical protein